MPNQEPPKIVGLPSPGPLAKANVTALLERVREHGVLQQLKPQGGTTTELAAEARADGDHRRGMRDTVARKIINTLWGEIAILAVLMLLQGFELWGFKLNQWVFGMFVNGVLLQTFFTVKIIVKNLFPDGLKHDTT